MPTYAEPTTDVISPNETVELVKSGALLLDVRTPKEFEDGHIANAQNVPLQDLIAGPAKGLPEDHAKLIVTICGVGKRSLNALQLLKAKGYERVKSTDGGMQAWKSGGFPLQIN